MFIILEVVRTYTVSWLGASPFKIHFFGTPGGLTSRALNVGNSEVEQFHGSCSGNKGFPSLTSASAPPTIALATPPAVALLHGTATPVVPGSPEPSSSSLSAITHRTKYIIFSETKKRQKNTYCHHGKQKKLWVFLSLGRNQQRKREKTQFPS